VRYRCSLIGVLVALAVPVPPALAANTNVAVSSNQFTAKDVTVNQGDTVTWHNNGGTHNVHFDDNSFIMPSPPSSAAWTVLQTFNTPGTFRYYCQVHGGPGGIGMSGTVTVNGTGYPRPKGASPLRASLAPAYKPCTASNRTHGAPLAFASCSPPVQVSNYVTVGSPDANSAAANSVGSITLKVLASADVSVRGSITDVRKKTDLTDYTGELQAKLPLQITDKLNGPSGTASATGSTSISFTIPCAATGSTTIGSTCSITTTANSVIPGSAVAGSRAVWELQNVQVYDGGADNSASTTGDNTLFADDALFVP
jgi:plastocyanin